MATSGPWRELYLFLPKPISHTIRVIVRGLHLCWPNPVALTSATALFATCNHPNRLQHKATQQAYTGGPADGLPKAAAPQLGVRGGAPNNGGVLGMFRGRMYDRMQPLPTYATLLRNKQQSIRMQQSATDLPHRSPLSHTHTHTALAVHAP